MVSQSGQVARVARRVADAGLGPLAVFLLEAAKPVGGLLGHGLDAVGPLLGAWGRSLRQVRVLLAQPNELERLILRIEQEVRAEGLPRRRERFREALARLRRIRRGRRSVRG